MSISGAEVPVPKIILHGYDLKRFRQRCESFQQLHRKGRGKLGLDHHEVAALLEEAYTVTERGEVLPQPRFIPLTSSMRMVVKIVTRLRPEFSLDFGHLGWSLLKRSVEVRNRIVHP